jgi:hypothetical protein
LTPRFNYVNLPSLTFTPSFGSAVTDAITETLTPTFPTITLTPSVVPTSTLTQTSLPFVPTNTPKNWGCTSPDGLYGGLQNGLHYQVFEIQNDRLIFTSRAKYETDNDAKACEFSSDSSKFAAAYHYSDNGEYTWIGVWSITGEWQYDKQKDGFTTDFSGVFDGP